MSENFTCTLCGGPVTRQQVSFIDDGKLWSISILICKAPKCLTKRGATAVDHKVEKRGNAEVPTTKESTP